MALGDYLKELREERKMTTYEVAKISGVNQSYISQMERGQKHPSPDILRKLAPALMTTYGELLHAAGVVESGDKIIIPGDATRMAIKTIIREIRTLTKELEDLTEKL